MPAVGVNVQTRYLSIIRCRLQWAELLRARRSRASPIHRRRHRTRSFFTASVLQAQLALRRREPPRPRLLKQSALGHVEIPAADVFSLCLPSAVASAATRTRHTHAALSERRETAEHQIMQFVTPTKAADPLDGLPPPPRSPRPEPKWLAWPPSKLPQRPKTFTALKGSSGLVICVGLNKDGSYVAFDGNCYHMGEPLFDGCGAGDIEDDVVR